MVREGYLTRVTRMVEDVTRRTKRSHGQLQALPPGMVDLLDLLRIATLETVEAISLWRLTQVSRLINACFATIRGYIEAVDGWPPYCCLRCVRCLLCMSTSSCVGPQSAPRARRSSLYKCTRFSAEEPSPRSRCRSRPLQRLLCGMVTTT